MSAISIVDSEILQPEDQTIQAVKKNFLPLILPLSIFILSGIVIQMWGK